MQWWNNIEALESQYRTIQEALEKAQKKMQKSDISFKKRDKLDFESSTYADQLTLLRVVMHHVRNGVLCESLSSQDERWQLISHEK